MKNVLIAVSYDLIRSSITAYLEKKGINVKTAASSDEAATMLSDFKPDGAIISLSFPPRGGEEVIDLVSKANESAHIWVFSNGKPKPQSANKYTFAMDFNAEEFIAAL